MKDREAIVIIKAALEAQKTIIDTFIDSTGKPPTADDIYLLMPIFIASFVLQFDESKQQEHAVRWFLSSLTDRSIEVVPVLRDIVLSGPYTEVKI